MNKTKLALAISVTLALQACGGGGGGTSMVRPNVNYQTPVAISSFTPLVGGGTDPAVADIFVKDLNNDNIDEVVFGGRESQSSGNVGANIQDYNMQLFGFNNNGNFTNETSSWFAGSDNVIKGTEPSIKFGDFNGDGQVDMLVAASTDSNTKLADNIVYLNTGTSSFTKSTISVGTQWSHDSVVKDVNNDGFDDIFVTDYLGNPSISFGKADGTFDTFTNNGAAINRASSGASIGDFLNNGTQTIVMTDAGGAQGNDTKLFSFTTVAGVLTLNEIATLPGSIFNDPSYAVQVADSPFGIHGIRNIAMDFNGDGVDDIIVFDRLRSISAIQFLANDGAGNFTDVTSTTLQNFDENYIGGYNPVVSDFNGDGLLDIQISGTDFDGNYNSTKVLLQSSDGKFVESYVDTFKAFHDEIEAATANATGLDQTIRVLDGPNGERFLVSSVVFQDAGDFKTQVFLAKIGTSGTMLPQTAANIIMSAWPYIAPSEAALALSLSGNKFNGIDVINLDTALNPINGLGLTFNGRTGQRVGLSGFISAPGFDSKMLQDVSAIDGLGREFKVDLQTLGLKQNHIVSNTTQVSAVNQQWSAGLVGALTFDSAYATSTTDNQGNYLNSIKNVGLAVNSNWSYQIGTGKLDYNPWMAINGVFGKINSSSLIDVTVGYKENDYWIQGGFSQITTTDLSQGLVTEITPIRAVYATAGYDFNYNTEDTFSKTSLYSGIAPYIVDGSMNLNIPNSVDFGGTLHYRSEKVKLRNPLAGFIGVKHLTTTKDYGNFGSTATLDSVGGYSLGTTYEFKF